MTSLHVDLLPPAQRRLWDELGGVPPRFTLYGGTAIALYLGHRESLDFDFFGSEPFNPQQLYTAVPFLKGAEITPIRLPVWLSGTGTCRSRFLECPT